MIEFFNPADAPAPGAFSRATRAAGLVFVSGTGAGNDIGGAPREGTAAEQTRWALENVAAILRAAGSSLDRVVQVTLLIQDPADYHEINAEYVSISRRGCRRGTRRASACPPRPRSRSPASRSGPTRREAR